MYFWGWMFFFDGLKGFNNVPPPWGTSSAMALKDWITSSTPPPTLSAASTVNGDSSNTTSHRSATLLSSISWVYTQTMSDMETFWPSKQKSMHPYLETGVSEVFFILHKFIPIQKMLRPFAQITIWLINSCNLEKSVYRFTHILWILLGIHSKKCSLFQHFAVTVSFSKTYFNKIRTQSSKSGFSLSCFSSASSDPTW